MKSKKPFSAAECLERGITHLNAKEYELAVAELEQVLAIDPVECEAMIRLGHVYLQQKEYSRAIEQFNRALAIDSCLPGAHEGLGLCYFEQLRISEAKEKFQCALRLKSGNEHSHFGLGLCYMEKAEFGLAIGEFKHTLEINPRHHQAYSQLGMCYYHKQDIKAAVENFNRAMDLSAQDYSAHYGLGLCYQYSQEFAHAIEELKLALRINPASGCVRHGLGSCYKHLKQLDNAISEFKLAIESDNLNECARQDLGICYYEQRKFDQAAVEFSQVLKINPRNASAHHGLGYIYLERRQYTLAINEFNEVINLDSGLSGVAHQGLGSAYLELEEYGLARAAFEKALESDPESIFLYQMLGYIDKRQGKSAQAVDKFIRATSLYLARERAPKTNQANSGFTAKIFRMPGFASPGEIHSTELDCSLLPPLAIGQISAYLKANGINIAQDDLNIKIHYDNYYSCPGVDVIDVSVFFDEARIIRYATGGVDAGLELILEKVEKKTVFSGFGIILLSLPVIFSNTSCLMFTLSLARFLKKKYNPILVLGGAKQTLDLLSKYDCRDIDIIISGEGEIPLLKLLSELKTSGSFPEFFASQVRDGTRFVCSDIHPPLAPDFSGLPMDKYRYRGIGSGGAGDSGRVLDSFHNSRVLILPFKFIKGCPYECVFCASSGDKLIYALEPSRVAAHLKDLQERYRPTGFFFLSDTINISKTYINELCDEIIRSKVKVLWSDCARADNLDRDTLFKMRASGCIRLIFGMETASPRLLKYIDKRISLRRLNEILQWADEAGIWTGLEVICGLPHEKEEDIRETVMFLNKAKAHINTLYFNQFDLRDGSVILRDAHDFGVANITQIDQYANLSEGFSYFHKYGYDEIGGLSWPDKRGQIMHSYNEAMSSATWNIKFPVYEFEHFLFFLYAKFGDKRKVLDVFNPAALKKNNLLERLFKESAAEGARG